MNLRQLETFVKVAETKSFSMTAKLLFITQPTVSAHISSLEKELNTCLLVRSTKEVELSDTGKELYAYAEQMLELEGKIKQRFGQGTGSGGSVLRIAASTIPSQYLLPEVMALFRKRYPKERLKVFETDSAGVLEMTASHTADIGFAGSMQERGNCTFIPFYEDELVLITPVAEPFQKWAGGVPGEDTIAAWLRNESVLLREDGSGTRREAAKILQRMGIRENDLHIAAIMQNQETMKRSVSGGMGITILSALAAKEEEKAGRLLVFPLAMSGGSRKISLVFDAAYPKLPAAERFVKVLKEVYPINVRDRGAVSD